MKYSIESHQDISDIPITFHSKLAKTFTHFSSTTSLQLTQQNKLKLKHIVNQYGLQVQQNKAINNMQIELQVVQQIKWQQLRYVWSGQQQWILFFQNPFRLLFILNKYKQIVPIILAQQIPLTQLACWVNYPQAIIYGHNEATFTNHIYSINLVTFESKQLPPSKNYSPGNRRDYWAYFSDNRLYIYGGVDKKGSAVEELFWTYNLQNGNWFALDMPSNNLSLPTYGFNCELESGKVLVLSDKGLVLVELYQSRLNQVEGWNDLIQNNYNNIKGIFVYKGNLFIHDEEKILPIKLKINKTKVKK